MTTTPALARLAAHRARMEPANDWRTEAVWLCGVRPVVLGQYRDSDRWNGWLCPSFDALTVVDVLETLNEDQSEEYEVVWDFDAYGALVLSEAFYPDAEPEVIMPDADGLYSLGAYAWTWSRVDAE